MPDSPAASDEFDVPFIFVPHGDPEPTEWMARHPGWVKFPARFVPHEVPAPDDPVTPVHVMTMGMTAGSAAVSAGLGDAVIATVETMGAAVAASPLAGLVILGGVFWPKRLNAGEVVPPRYPRKEGAGGSAEKQRQYKEEITALPPQPPLPGLVPPEIPFDRPGEGGLGTI